MRVAKLTDNQDRLLCALDDAVEHVSWEFDPDDYAGVSTCGFAHIHIPDGRCSFIQTLRGLAKSDATPNVIEVDGRPGYTIQDLGVELQASPAHDGGYRLSITNTRDLAHGPSYQRIDLQERLHNLFLSRLQFEWGYLNEATVRSRMD